MTESKPSLIYKSCKEIALEKARFKTNNPIGYFFKYKIYYPFRRLLSKLEDVPYQVKWFLQRGKRGWADCDAWSIDAYILLITGEMLERLAKTKYGSPIGVSHKRWVTKLKANALRCRTILKFIDTGDFKSAQKLFKKLLKFYEKYYFNLWD